MTPRAAATLSSARPGPGAEPLAVVPGMALAPGRAHEICGIARRHLALRVAAATAGPVLWIAPAWEPARPGPAGARRWLDPGRLLHVSPSRPRDLLWAAEESLRSGAAALVVADLPAPPGLTPVRRLHLAAETGGEGASRPPLALILTPEGAAPGIETRWSARPAARPGAEGWRIALLRARGLPPAEWWSDLPPAAEAGGRLELVSRPG